MELHQLRYAVEVHRRCSFTAAAEALHVSQSGVSAQVAKLERDLGVRLFDRGPRTATPTAEGVELLPLMVAALAAIDSIQKRTDELLELSSGTIRIGTVIGCTIPGYLDAFSELRSAYPGVTVSSREGNSNDLIAQLISGDLDIALLAHAGPLPPQFDTTTIIDEPLAVGVPPDHPWATKSTIPAAYLAEENVLTLAEGTGIRTALQRTCDIAGVTLEPTVEAHSPETVHSLATRGAGVPVLSASMIAAPLVAVKIRNAQRTQLSLASRRQQGIAAHAFIKILRVHLIDGPRGDASTKHQMSI